MSSAPLKIAESALISGFFLILLFWAVPPVWDHYDGLLAHFAQGLLSEFSITKSYFFVLYKVNLIFLELGRKHPFIPWFALFYYSCVIIYLVCAVHYFRTALGNNRLEKVLLIGFACILFYKPLVDPSLMALSFLMCGTSFYFGLHWVPTLSNKIYRIAWYSFFLALYGIGFLIKLEPGLGSSYLVGIHLLLFSKDFTHKLKWLLPFVIVAGFLSYEIVNSIRDEPFLQETEYNMFYIGDNFKADLNTEAGLSKKDSIKVVGLKSFYMNDLHELTPSFIDSVASLKRQKISELHQNSISIKISTALSLASETILKNSFYLPLLVYFLFLFIVLQKSFAGILFHIGFWVAVMLLAYFIKIEDRHYLPLCMIFTALNAITVFNDHYRKELVVKSFAVALMVSFVILVYPMIQEGTNRRTSLSRISDAGRELNYVTENKILLLDMHAIELYRVSPFRIQHFNKAKNLIFYDFGELAVLKEYNSHLDKICGCNSRVPTEFWKWVSDNANDIILISTRSRMNFFQDYMDIVHNYEYVATPMKLGDKLELLKFNGEPILYFQVRAKSKDETNE